MSKSLNLQIVDLRSSASWHSWLDKNHLRNQGACLVFRKGGLKSISYDEALDWALAYGWIDSVIKKIDDVKYVRKFTPRRSYSIWSRLNIARVQRLKKEGRMTRWGLEAYEKRTGEISLLEKFNKEGVKTPKDLEEALEKNKKALEAYGRFSPSHRKRYLIWISAAKRPETRARRIEEAV
jgi:uncharacterized protein YdeI (YjbR/CyaY-like superfamily)